MSLKNYIIFKFEFPGKYFYLKELLYWSFGLHVACFYKRFRMKAKFLNKVIGFPL